MISIDDFHPKNLELAKLIKSYGLESETWFAIELKYKEAIPQIKKLSKMGFNIASHTCSHSFLNEIDPVIARLEMSESKKRLEEITGKKVEWLVLPRGRYNDEVLQTAFELGYKYIRTTKLTDDNERVRGGAHLSYPRKEYEGVDPFVWAKQSGLKHFWFHYSEVEKFFLMDKIKEFLEWYRENIYTRLAGR